MSILNNIMLAASQIDWTTKTIENLYQSLMGGTFIGLGVWGGLQLHQWQAMRGDYRGNIVVSVTSIYTPEYGGGLALRSIDKERVLEDLILGNKADMAILKKAINGTSLSRPILNLPPSAEARLVPKIRSFVSALDTDARAAWLGESVSGIRAKGMHPFLAVLTCEHGGPATKVRLIIVSEETLKRLPPEDQLDSVARDEPHHLQRLQTLWAIRKHQERKLQAGKDGFPMVWLSARCA